MIIDNSAILQQLKDKKQFLKSMVDCNEDVREMVLNPFWSDIKLRFCWSSNAIEGNTLSLDETIDVIMYDEVHAGHTYAEYTDAKNLYKAIEEYLRPYPADISEDWIIGCNSVINGSKDSGYRKKNVYIGTVLEAVYYPPEFSEVPVQMKELLKFQSTGEIEDIAKYHIIFERIHPFPDGNGRTGRMILNQQLINNGYLPIAIDKTSKYRQAFKTYDRSSDVSLLTHIICSEELKSIGRVEKLMSMYKASRDIKEPEENNESRHRMRRK